MPLVLKTLTQKRGKKYMAICKLIKIKVVATCDYCAKTMVFDTEAGWRKHFNQCRNPEHKDKIFCKKRKCYIWYKLANRYGTLIEEQFNEQCRS